MEKSAWLEGNAFWSLETGPSGATLNHREAERLFDEHCLPSGPGPGSGMTGGPEAETGQGWSKSGD